MELNLETKQTQTISARQIQFMSILQMSNQELLEYLNEALVENPVLDAADNYSSEENQDLMRKLQWLEAQDVQNRHYINSDANEGIDAVGNYAAPMDEETLFSHIRMQLDSLGLSAGLYKAACFVAANLNDSGYLDTTLGELAASCSGDEVQLKEALELIRTLEPAGVAAFDLADCLCLQLERLKGAELAEQIVRGYLKKLSKNQYGSIAGELKNSEKAVRNAASLIRTLNPKPGAGFNPGTAPVFVRPDVIIVKFENYFEILNVDYELPTLQINSYYNKLLQESDDRELVGYLSGKVRQAKWLINNISQRQTTLLNCTRAILDAQEPFFRGHTNNLSPLTLAELAQVVGISESTVSRAIKGKYLQCRRGVFPMNYFFPRRVRQGEDMSATRARDILREIVDAEDKRKPLSDMKIVQKLQERGIEISRRTVAKYRGELFIPGASGRKLDE